MLTCHCSTRSTHHKSSQNWSPPKLNQWPHPPVINANEWHCWPLSFQSPRLTWPFGGPHAVNNRKDIFLFCRDNSRSTCVRDEHAANENVAKDRWDARASASRFWRLGAARTGHNEYWSNLPPILFAALLFWNRRENVGAWWCDCPCYQKRKQNHKRQRRTLVFPPKKEDVERRTFDFCSEKGEALKMLQVRSGATTMVRSYKERNTLRFGGSRRWYV